MDFLHYNYGPKWTPSKSEYKKHSFIKRRLLLLNYHSNTIIGQFKEIFEIFFYIWQLKWPLLIWLIFTLMFPVTLLYTVWFTLLPMAFYVLKQTLLFATTLIGVIYITIFGAFGWNIFYRDKMDKSTYIELIKIV